MVGEAKMRNTTKRRKHKLKTRWAILVVTVTLSLIVIKIMWVDIDYTPYKDYETANTAIHTQLKNHTIGINTINLSVSKLKENMMMRAEDIITLYRLTDVLTKELSVQLDEIEALEANIEQLQTERYKDDK